MDAHSLTWEATVGKIAWVREVLGVTSFLLGSLPGDADDLEPVLSRLRG